MHGCIEEKCKRTRSAPIPARSGGNFDQFLYEMVSSTCAVVGFFVGYSMTLPEDTSELCPSRQTQAECGLEYIAAALPPGQCGSEE